MTENNKNYNIFLATGGSGGHIFPALAIAEKLAFHQYSVYIIADEVYKKYSRSNLNYRIIRSGKSLKSFKSIKNIICGFFEAKKILNFEKPSLVVGFGSYATLPILMACLWTKTPFILHEQNAYIGKINKLFAKYSKKIMTTYHEIYGANYNDMSKIIYTGNPARESIKKLYNLTYSYPSGDQKFTVLITGGSAGARIFSEYLPKIFDKNHVNLQSKLKIYHQVREEYLTSVKEHYNDLKLNAVVSPFFENMGELLSEAHLIIGRAGSGTLIETSIAGRPSILIPLKNSNNNRQEVNAESFAKNKASIMILEKDFNIDDFQKIFFDLIENKEKLIEMSNNAKKMAVLNADENVFNVIKEELNNDGRK